MSHTHTDKNGFPLQRRHEAHGGARKPVMSEADDIAERMADKMKANPGAGRGFVEGMAEGMVDFAATAAVKAAIEAGPTKSRSPSTDQHADMWDVYNIFHDLPPAVLASEYDNLPTIPGCD